MCPSVSNKEIIHSVNATNLCFFVAKASKNKLECLSIHSCIIFSRESRAYPTVLPSLTFAGKLEVSGKLELERPVRDKHFSLFHPFINDEKEEKDLYNL
jgi:hypothetical protein